MNVMLTLRALLATVLLVILSNVVFMFIHSEIRDYSFAWMVYLLNLPVLYLCYKIVKSLFKEGGIKFTAAVNASPDMDFKAQDNKNQ